MTDEEQDTLHFNGAVILPFQARESDDERWLVDSGSTVHVTNNPHGITHWCKAQETIIVGNGQEVKANFKGTVHIQVKNATLTLHDVLFVPGFAKNIISVSRLVRHGNNISITEDAMLVIAPNAKSLEAVKDNRSGMYYIRGKRVYPAQVMDTSTSSQASPSEPGPSS